MEVLSFLRGPPFETLSSRPLQVVTMTVLFLLSLATAKRVGELQAVSPRVAFQGDILSLSYIPEFVAKIEYPIPWSFLVRFLARFLGGLLNDHFLCPVRAVGIYLALTSYFSPRPRSLFVSPRHLSRSLSKNAYLFSCVIIDADALWEGATPHAHSISGVATSAVFLRN